MSESRWNDFYDRLSSRKLWLALLSITFAFWNYSEGRMTAVEFQQFVTASVITFSVAEGAADAVAAYRPKPASGDAQTVNVGTEPIALAAPVTEPPVATMAPKRVRPSRAKPKTAPAVLTEPVVSVPTPRRSRAQPAVESAPAEPERVRVVPAGRG